MKALILSIGIVMLMTGCGDTPTGQSGADPFRRIDETPMADAEAEMAAFYYSGELVAPVGLYNKIHQELALIREKYSDLTYEVEGRPANVMEAVKFTPPDPASRIWVGFDSVTADSINNGQYHAWDYLNINLRLDTMYILLSRHFNLQFEGRLNPDKLVDLYAGLPGCTYVETDAMPHGRSVVIITSEKYNKLSGLTRNLKLNYCFVLAWGDCPSGCLYAVLFDFEVNDGHVRDLGQYRFTDPGPRPEWVEPVREALVDYINYYKIWIGDSSQVFMTPGADLAVENDGYTNAAELSKH